MSLPACFALQRYRAAIEAARKAQLYPARGRLTSLTVLDSDGGNTLAQMEMEPENLGNRLPSDFDHGTVLLRGRRRGGRVLSAEEGSPGRLVLLVSLPGEPHDLPRSGRVTLFPYDHLAALHAWAEGLRAIPRATQELLAQDILLEGDPRRLLETDGLKPLDSRQRRAVERFARKAFLLWGPPGTGKTHTMASAVVSMLSRGWRVSVIALSNAAVDVATLAIDDACTRAGRPLEPRQLIRLGTPRHPALEGEERSHLLAFQKELELLNRKLANARRTLAATVRRIREARRRGETPPDRAVALKASLLQLIHEAEDERRALTREHVESARILCSTAASYVMLEHAPRADAMLVDEGSQMPLALLYHLTARRPHRFHVVGDPMQLAPIVPRVWDRRLRDDVVELFGSSRFTLAELDPAAPGFPDAVERLERRGGLVPLLEQRRMAPEIGELVSRLAYQGRLRHAAAPAADPEARGILPAARLVHVVAPGTGRSTSSHAQAELTRRVAAGLLEDAEIQEDGTAVLVLTPYRKQEKLLSDLLGSVPGVRVLTIHKAQGSEAPSVVLDVPAPLNRFLDNPGEARLLWNVACSRARHRLVLVAPNTVAANRWIGAHLHRFARVEPGFRT